MLTRTPVLLRAQLKRLHPFLSVLLLFLLTGCDPIVPVGIRQIGVAQLMEEKQSNIIAVEHCWGVCGNRWYQSTDGGFTWADVPLEKQENLATSTLDCAESCEWSDPQLEFVRYRLRSGKSKVLQRSLDGGQTWQTELEVPLWNQMQKNYVKASFDDVGPDFPIEERGPFGAITDPQTSNLIVAMGYEGVLVRTKDQQWHWVSIGKYHQVQPARLEMIGLIESWDWLRGPLAALLLMLIGLYFPGKKELRFLHWFTIIGATIILLLPFQLLLCNAIIWPLLIVLFLRSVTDYTQIHRPINPKLALTAVGAMVSNWLAFLVWSQGILPIDYAGATLAALALILVAFILVLYFMPKTQS